ncbi:MAG: hypothetical protein JW969_05385 [Spirochaetales bacterium]|nr:hypothetical protein [Spirochaetales bacterium]
MKKILLLFILLLMVISGCATTINIKVTKPAEVNMAGARTLAVMDFVVANTSEMLTIDQIWEQVITKAYGIEKADTLEQRLSNYTTQSLISTLYDTKYFTLILPRDVGKALSGMITTSPNPVQIGILVGAKAILTGSATISYIDQDIPRQFEVFDLETGETVTKIEYLKKKEASLDFTYRIINTSTGFIMATKSFIDTYSKEVAKEDEDTLPQIEDIFRDMINKILPRIAHQIAPYEVTEYRSLMNDETKNPKMAEADDLVKKGLYDIAFNIFKDVWEQSRNPAAAVNSAIMLEATGKLPDAVKFLEEAVVITSNERIALELKRLRDAAKDLKALKEQTE